VIPKYDIPILILAAGSSTRLGEPKQLLPIKDQTLLSYVVKKALKLSPYVNVVLGHEYSKCFDQIFRLPITCINNSEYEKGMGSSISCGIKKLDDTKPILIMLCDQPLIPLEHYEKLIRSYYEHNKKIVGSLYSSNITVPAIFPPSYKKDLANLQGEKGAKILLSNPKTLAISLKKEYAKDIDTKKEWEEISKLIF